ncbi:TAFII28-like protein [Cordyceps fumosorosea ARSEF 2679]|uniref:TAFII28-like protein n=1 Tax=Cordyceps fumosorosea (strain ARSEF 2679) TaxID=1081104 RepID=A0A168DA54_CORFA|nr:TAFII28-like protein [Cordyceps fumosorosea ARSEF 2679]OAA72347.1 TAFII28-like protein [Cordyceps fumosorosea ARSEF 2679]
MASPPHVASPTAMSPPYPSPASIPSKKRSPSLDMSGKPPALKRRKASTLSQSSVPAHPLRQTSFPPEARSPRTRSPSMDAQSHVSGSVASGVGSTAVAAARKKRGRKLKAGGKGGGDDGGKGDDQASSVAGGGKAATAASGTGDKDAEDDEDEDKAEMALEAVVAHTQEQKQEEIRLRAMLVEAFDSEQYNRYELWRAAKLSDAVVKRVVNATVSQSVPQMVSTAVKAVAKLFAGEIIEEARQVQAEWIRAGEHQSELPTPPPTTGDAAGDDDATGGGGDEDREKDPRRGPLRPDHLRAAWLRYRESKQSHGVGMQQLWHNQQGSGVERFSARTRKQIFK